MLLLFFLFGFLCGFGYFFIHSIIRMHGHFSAIMYDWLCMCRYTKSNHTTNNIAYTLLWWQTNGNEKINWRKLFNFGFASLLLLFFLLCLLTDKKKLFFRFWLCAFLVVGDSCGGIYFCSFALVVVVVISLFRSSLFFILFLLHNIQCYRMLYDCHIHTFTIHGKLLGIAILCVLVRFSLLHVNV